MAHDYVSRDVLIDRYLRKGLKSLFGCTDTDTCSYSFGLSSMESKAPENPSSVLYWEWPDGLRHLFYFILLFFLSEFQNQAKKSALRCTRQRNSRTKRNHSPSSLNWARHMKEDESSTALRKQWLGAKFIKSGENPECSFPSQPQHTMYTHNWHLRGCRCPQTRNPSI